MSCDPTPIPLLMGRKIPYARDLEAISCGTMKTLKQISEGKIISFAEFDHFDPEDRNEHTRGYVDFLADLSKGVVKLGRSGFEKELAEAIYGDEDSSQWRRDVLNSHIVLSKMFGNAEIEYGLHSKATVPLHEDSREMELFERSRAFIEWYNFLAPEPDHTPSVL